LIERKDIQKLIDRYDPDHVKIGCVGSHSGLDICDGAVAEGFETLVVCQKGREKTYSNYFRASRDGHGKVLRGMVDEIILLDKFKEILEPKIIEALIDDNVLFVPNRSFTSYVPLEDIEDHFPVPLVGSRNLLRSEERGEKKDYYWLLEKAGLPFPEKVKDPKDIDGLTMVKLHHAQKKLERGFFTCSSFKDYKDKSEALIKQKVIMREDLAGARLEKYIIGPVFNLDFFYSPIERTMQRIELLGIDWRFESSLDGHVRLPAPQQLALGPKEINPEYTVVGHNSCTLRESLLEDAFELAEKYVKATQEHYAPGIIGPFCLQTCVDKDMQFYIYDVAPRVGGGTNVHMAVGHAYGNSVWRREMSTGRRVALEVRRAAEAGKLKEIVT
jgi:5-formaminoimidazole-4-carboxamide-1-(beta)-D-ribofuranosyl 5'-monophosphate synthetase